MENGKPVPPSMVMCICPRCERPAGDDACPGCGQALDKRDGLLIVLIDKVTDKDRELLGRVATGFTAGTWEPKKGRLVCRTPEEWATLADSAGRLLRRKGTDLLGPTGLRFDPDDPVLRCLATRKTSALRTCMTQGLGDSYCAALPGLLPLADEPGHLSLSDGLVARGLDATRLVAAVLHGLCEKEHSPLRCPLFASALQGVPVGTALLASMEEALADHPSNVVLPVAPAEAPPGAPPGAPAWTEVPLPPVTARETLQPVGPRPEGPLTWAAGLEDGVFADRDGSPLLLATEAGAARWTPAPLRHAGDLCLVIPSRWHLFCRRFPRGRRGEDLASWHLPVPGPVALKSMPASLEALASFGSVPVGPPAMLISSSQRLVVWWPGGEEPPAVIPEKDVRGDRWRMVPLGDRFLVLWSDRADVLLCGAQVLWRLSPSRPGERWPENPWYSALFEGVTGILPVQGLGLAVLSSAGHRVSLLALDEAAAAEAVFSLDLMPPVRILDELLLPWPATSMGVDREGRLYLAGDRGLLLLDPRARTFARGSLDGGSGLAMANGGWLVEQDQEFLRLLLTPSPSAEDFGEDLAPFLRDLSAAARDAENLKSRRNSMVENLYSLVRRRARRGRRATP